MVYIKKPTFVEAIRWDGENLNEVKKFVEETDIDIERFTLSVDTIKQNLFICSDEGYTIASVGDYIVANTIVKHIYSCTKKIFEENYEPYVEPEPDIQEDEVEEEIDV